MDALAAILLLAPAPPLLFMGEEWGCRQPFLFFCDFPGELGEAVRKGRREEFARFAAFQDRQARERIPDPLAEGTFRQCVLDWQQARGPRLELYRELLEIRAREIAPRQFPGGAYDMLGKRAFRVRWGGLTLVANCGEQPVRVQAPAGRALWSNGEAGQPWTVGWWISG